MLGTCLFFFPSFGLDLSLKPGEKNDGNTQDVAPAIRHSLQAGQDPHGWWQEEESDAWNAEKRALDGATSTMKNMEKPKHHECFWHLT